MTLRVSRSLRPALARNAGLDVLGILEVVVRGDGSFEISSFRLLSHVRDPGDVIRRHYEAEWDRISRYRFMRPGAAGLSAPVRLVYRLRNAYGLWRNGR